MTPPKCREHTLILVDGHDRFLAADEFRPGEFAEEPRYTQALIDSRTCIRCRLLAIRAHIVYFFVKGRS